jgi:hypothetical protein
MRLKEKVVTRKSIYSTPSTIIIAVYETADECCDLIVLWGIAAAAQ